ncbi:MAG: hypothetical protein AAGD14_19860 [Planctomycetota bacterium]
MRTALVVFLLAATTLAQGRRPPKPEEIEAVRTIVGAEAWGELPEWRRRDIVRRYLRYVDSDERKQEAVRAAGLKDYLTAASRKRGPRLPRSLEKEIEALPASSRSIATKLAVVRVRQLRLDRNLALIARKERVAWFERLFPEPFDPRAAREAKRAFDKQVAAAVARQLRKKHPDLAEMTREQQREIVRADTVRREEKVVQRVSRELKRLRDVRPERLPPQLDLLLQRRDIYGTPRQRELIRWALRPADSPLLDFRWMGKPPAENRRARIQWERDRVTLARMELLTRAGFPEPVVLHLASAGSDQEFVRSLRGLIGRRGDPAR